MKFLASFFALVCVFGFSNALFKEVNMFSAVGGFSNTLEVTPAIGYRKNSSAYHFKARRTNLIANAQAMVDAAKLIHESHDFVVSAYTKVDSSAIYANNPIVFMSSIDGQHTYFLVAIKNTYRSKLKIEFSFYTNGDLRSITTLETRRRIEVDKWHKFELRVQDSERLVKVLVDDELVEVQLFEYTLDALPSNSQLRLAQTYHTGAEGVPEIQEWFKGSLQDVTIKLGSKDCKVIPKPCKCPEPGGNQCIMNGVEYKEGDQWQKNNCTRSLCRNNKIIYVYTCTPCSDGSNVYIHGDRWINNDCKQCECRNGTKTCSPVVCPPPDCSGKSGRKITLPGKCCPICVEDQCNGTGKVYRQCGCDKTCATLTRPCQSCKEGCFCKDIKDITDGRCRTSFNCGCTYDNIYYEEGAAFYKGGNPCIYCQCQKGKVACAYVCGK